MWIFKNIINPALIIIFSLRLSVISNIVKIMILNPEYLSLSFDLVFNFLIVENVKESVEFEPEIH